MANTRTIDFSRFTRTREEPRSETFANAEEYRHKHPNRETRPLWEREMYPDSSEQKKKDRERGR